MTAVSAFKNRGVALMGGLLLAGCASTSTPEEALRALSARTGVRLQSYGGRPSPGVADTLRLLLESPLTAEAAVQVAALNSPRFQALLQDLRIARADQRQDRLLPNPTLELALRGEGFGGGDFEYALLEDLRAVLLYPVRRGLADSRYERDRMRLAGELLEEIEKVKVACFELQGLAQTRSLMQSTLQVAEASAELAARQRQAGTINALEEAMRQAALHQARLAAERIEAELQTARQELGRLLGPVAGDWQLAEELPPLPETDPPLPVLEAQALARPDLEAARQEVQLARGALRLARFSAVPALEVGVDFKKEEERRTAGPAVEVQLPLFDRGQAARARARAQQDQSRLQLLALEAEARAQVQTRFTRLSLARRAARHYRDHLVPLRAQAVAEAQKHYNYMLLGVYQLLQLRQEEVEARQAWVEALRDYWVARAQLERAIGGPLPPGEERPPAQEDPPPPPPPSHPHHH